MKNKVPISKISSEALQDAIEVLQAVAKLFPNSKRGVRCDLVAHSLNAIITEKTNENELRETASRTVEAYRDFNDPEIRSGAVHPNMKRLAVLVGAKPLND